MSDLSTLTSLRAADTLRDGTEIVAPRYLGEHLGTAYAALGFKAADGPSGVAVYAPDGDAFRRVAYAEVLDCIRAAALDLLERLAADTDRAATRRRLTATARILRENRTGATTWIRDALAAARAALPTMTEADLAAVAATAPTLTPAELAARATARRERDAAARADAEAEAATILDKWLGTFDVADGEEIPIGDVWAEWTAAVRALADRETRRRLAAIGRTRFYRLLAELRPVRSVGARRRVVTLHPTEATEAAA